jgi:acetyltransferase-like isoleucine patch superfamily enzyme
MATLKLQIRWALPIWLIGIFTNWLPDNRIVLRFRGKLASFFIKGCGVNFQLGSNVTLLNTHNLYIGDNVYIAKGTWLNCMGRLKIEDEVVLAPYVVISTLQHIFKNRSVRFGGSRAGQVIIKKGTWLAAHVSVKQGITIGEGNLVAANACVVKDTPDNVIIAGVPGKVIGDNRDGEPDFYTRQEFMKLQSIKG